MARTRSTLVRNRSTGFRVIADGSPLLFQVESSLPNVDLRERAPEIIVASASAVYSGSVSPADHPEALWLIVKDVEPEPTGLRGVMYKTVEASVEKVVEAANGMLRVICGVNSMFLEMKRRQLYGNSALS